MKKILKILGTALVVFVLITGVRWALRHWAPGFYTTVWGGPVNSAQPMVPIPEMKVDPGKLTQAGVTTKPLEKAEHKEEEVYATGRIWTKKEVWVIMSDATVRSIDDNTEDEPRVQRIHRHYMDYQGKRYYYKPHENKPPPRAAENFGEIPVVKKE